MTAAEIIAEIERLPLAEKRKVFDQIKKMPESRMLSPEELEKLARRMVETTEEAEAERLKAEIIRGFYGD